MLSGKKEADFSTFLEFKLMIRNRSQAVVNTLENIRIFTMQFNKISEIYCYIFSSIHA